MKEITICIGLWCVLFISSLLKDPVHSSYCITVFWSKFADISGISTKMPSFSNHAGTPKICASYVR
jgi:hypothetical protein